MHKLPLLPGNATQRAARRISIGFVNRLAGHPKDIDASAR
jgi:hypothetical protein